MGRQQHQEAGTRAPAPWGLLLDTDTYAQKNKVPQETIPDDVQVKIADEMLRAFERALSAPLPKPVFFRCQLWGAAVPLNSPGVDCIFDAEARVGVAGDWCSGAMVQHAALSGVELARKIVRLRDGASAAELNVGLSEPFRLLADTTTATAVAGPSVISATTEAPTPPSAPKKVRNRIQ